MAVTTLYSAIPREHSVVLTRGGKNFATLPAAFSVNGKKYAPALTEATKTTALYSDDVSSILFSFYEDAITVAASLVAEDAALPVEMTHLFVDGTIAPVGFDRAFTPQPRNNTTRNCAFYSSLPDISANGYHTPPMLNFSLGSPEGWISYGMLDIPDTRMCRMEENGSFLIESCGGHKLISKGDVYHIPRVLISFPTDEYDGISLFRTLLQRFGAYTPYRPDWSELPDWWKYPQFCTYGDQLIENRVGQLIDDAWVREFVKRVEDDFGVEHMVLCIDDSWQLPHCSAIDTKRFPDLRGLIDDMHARGHRVMLWYTPMFEKIDNDAESLPAKHGVFSKDIMTGRYFDSFPNCYALDYTSDGAEAFLNELARFFFSDAEGCLNADAVKLDFLANLRDPALASSYAHPERGIGMREYYRYYELFRKAAKAAKPDVMINATLEDPRFEHLIDVSRLHDTHSGEEEKERRARVMTLACPDLPVDTDGALMTINWLRRNHISAAVCGLHAVYYTYDCGYSSAKESMNPKLKKQLGQLVSMTGYRPAGTPIVDANGHWQLIGKDGRVMADTVRGETVVYYPEEQGGEGRIFTFLDELVTLPLHGRKFSSLTPAPVKEFCEVDYARDCVRVYLRAGVVYTFRDEDDGSSIDRVFREMKATASDEVIDYVN